MRFILNCWNRSLNSLNLWSEDMIDRATCQAISITFYLSFLSCLWRQELWSHASSTLHPSSCPCRRGRCCQWGGTTACEPSQSCAWMKQWLLPRWRWGRVPFWQTWCAAGRAHPSQPPASRQVSWWRCPHSIGSWGRLDWPAFRMLLRSSPAWSASCASFARHFYPCAHSQSVGWRRAQILSQAEVPPWLLPAQVSHRPMRSRRCYRQYHSMTLHSSTLQCPSHSTIQNDPTCL